MCGDVPVQPLDRSLICSPYVEPLDHWHYDRETGQPTWRGFRRPAGYYHKKLRDHGLLEKKGSGSATYYVPTTKLLGTDPVATADKGLVTGLNPPGKSLPTGLNPPDKAEVLGLGTLPAGLTQALLEIGERSDPASVRRLILDLCAWKPLQPSQLAALLNRSAKYLGTTYLRSMIASGELEYLYPDNPAHPKQAYKTKRADKSEGQV